MTARLPATPSPVPAAQLPEVLEALADAVLVHDTSERIVLLNSRAESLFGYSRDELLGRRIDVVIPGRAGATPIIGSDPARPFGVRLEVYGRRKDGREFPAEITLCALKTHQGRMVAGTVRDISARQAVERALTERNHELEAANKELEAFDYSIAHDLRAPLDRIEGFAAMLAKEHGRSLGGHGLEILRRISDAGCGMNQLVSDLLALSTATRGTVSRSIVDVSALAITIAAGLRKASPLQQVVFEAGADMKTRADAGLLRVVLQNLLANAWKFTRGCKPARIRVGCVETRTEHIFYVRDNGPGFETSQVLNVFKPFQRANAGNGIEGTGIGLATVRRIVGRHGGRVWAEASREAGATFFFTLASPLPAGLRRDPDTNVSLATRLP